MTTVVTDNGAPPLSATNSFAVFVTDANTAPALTFQADRTIAELTTLVVTNTATDTDVPVNTLTYALVVGLAARRFRPAALSPGRQTRRRAGRLHADDRGDRQRRAAFERN